MFEAGWNTLCSYVLFVDAPREVRLRRAREKRGWSDEQFAAREAAQRPVDWKRERSDVVIDNSGSIEFTCEQVRSWWSRVTKNEEIPEVGEVQEGPDRIVRKGLKRR